MVLNSANDVRLLNGYTGAVPLSYSSLVADVNTFPSPVAFERLDAAGTRYVVLSSVPLETGDPVNNGGVNASGFAYFEPDRLDAILQDLPADRIAERIDLADGILLVLED